MATGLQNRRPTNRYQKTFMRGVFNETGVVQISFDTMMREGTPTSFKVSKTLPEMDPKTTGGN